MLLLLALGIGLALGSFWLLQVMQRGATDAAPGARTNEPDYYVEKFNFVRMSKLGEARYNVAGAKMVHRPLDDTYEITLPVMHSLSQGQPPLMVRAERAIAVPDSSKVHMIDKVEADRPASATSDHFHLKSDYVLVLPDDDVLQSDRAVELTFGSTRLTGTGMYVNNATRQFKLAQHVHGIYPARATVEAARRNAVGGSAGNAAAPR